MSEQNPTSVWGTGYTPEGIDQNPIYYEFMAQQNFRAVPVPDIPNWAVMRAHRRYGFTAFDAPDPDVTAAWTLLANATYTLDISVQDSTGVARIPGTHSQFDPSGAVPNDILCQTFQAWSHMLNVANKIPDATIEPFRYDLVNLGREILAQLSTPMSMNFSSALTADPLDASILQVCCGVLF